jgi:hypothetical protein
MWHRAFSEAMIGARFGERGLGRYAPRYIPEICFSKRYAPRLIECSSTSRSKRFCRERETLTPCLPYGPRRTWRRRRTRRASVRQRARGRPPTPPAHGSGRFPSPCPRGSCVGKATAADDWRGGREATRARRGAARHRLHLVTRERPPLGVDDHVVAAARGRDRQRVRRRACPAGTCRRACSQSSCSKVLMANAADGRG